MFKKILISLVLALILCFITVPATAFEQNQECTVIEGSKIFQTMFDDVSGVLVPRDDPIILGDAVSAGAVAFFNSITGMDWTGARLASIEVDLGDGDIRTLEIIVKPSDVKDCN